MIKRPFILLAFVLSVLSVSKGAQAQDDVLKIYLDADRSRHFASAKSIEMGIKTAFSEIDNVIQGHKVEFVTLDHRGNSKRSKLNMDKAFADPDALLVMAGLHSPPLIKYRSYINEQEMLTLVPWAAGGPVTRHPSADNWIFRLSVDDTKAGYRIAGYAIERDGCLKPHLLLEQTAWGESNKKTMNAAVVEALGATPPVTVFNWGLAEDSAGIKLRHASEGGADCLFFVGNANDAQVFMKAMLSLDEAQRLPIYSHWGITGGNFHRTVNASMREELDLRFIQSCFSFVSSEQTPFSKAVFATAQALYPELRAPEDLKAPPGFIHAYDLGRILISALSQVELGDDMAVNRRLVKGALEDLRAPVQGLVKLYERPFSVYSEDKPDAHEALGINDICMAQYGGRDEIIVLPY